MCVFAHKDMVMKSPTGPDLCHCLAARRLARHTSRLYDRHLGEVGLSISQFSIIALIERTPGISIRELADEMVMERTTTVRGIKPLVDGGYVQAVSIEGKRGIHYSLTAAGKALHAKAKVAWKNAQDEFERASGKRRSTGVRNDMLELAGIS
jgi:DNA-binding MarR family transcriptional regulator